MGTHFLCFSAAYELFNQTEEEYIGKQITCLACCHLSQCEGLHHGKPIPTGKQEQFSANNTEVTKGDGWM